MALVGIVYRARRVSIKLLGEHVPVGTVPVVSEIAGSATLSGRLSIRHSITCTGEVGLPLAGRAATRRRR